MNVVIAGSSGRSAAENKSMSQAAKFRVAGVNGRQCCKDCCYSL